MVQKTSLRTYLELEVIILPSSFDQGKNNLLFSHESYFSVACTHQFLSAMWLCECCSHYLGNSSVLSSFISLLLVFKSQFIVASSGRLPLTFQTRVPLSVALVKVLQRHLWGRVNVFTPHCVPSAGYLNKCLLNE